MGLTDDRRATLVLDFDGRFKTHLDGPSDAEYVADIRGRSAELLQGWTKRTDRMEVEPPDGVVKRTILAKVLPQIGKDIDYFSNKSIATSDGTSLPVFIPSGEGPSWACGSTPTS